MAKTIKQPFRSPGIVLIMNRIHEMDHPYASGIANSLGDQVTDIQAHIETLHKRGWVSKERDGRRQVLSLNPTAIWQDSKHMKRLTTGSLFDRETGAIKDTFQDLLDNALLYKLFYAVDTTHNKEAAARDREGDVWIKGPDTLTDSDELTWYGCDTTLDEIMTDIVATLKTIALITDDERKHDLDIFTSAYDKWFVDHCSDILHGEETTDDFTDFVNDMVENPTDYV